MPHRQSAHILPFRRPSLFLLGLTLLGSGLMLPPSDAHGAGRKTTPPTAQGSFADHLSSFDTTRWTKADGWKNGAPFDNAWAADHITFSDGTMRIRLDNQPLLGEPYTSGNYQSNGFYGYGCYEARFKPVAASGVVSSFFTFAGPYDNGGNGKHNEIDIEFLGGDTSRFQTNFWTNDDAYAAGHEHIVYLSFDAAQDFHRYGFKWTSSGIEWYVDGVLVHAVFNTPEAPTPKATDSLQKTMMNIWPVDETASAWAGTFTYPGYALEGTYDWVRHIAGEACSLADEPTPPVTPPPGDPAKMHVQSVALTLNSRGDQAIAHVLITDGLGKAVSGVSVGGAWDGAITSGDTLRTTDANGQATFYSARSRSTGPVQFCVTSASGGGKTYDATANLETCETLTK